MATIRAVFYCNDSWESENPWLPNEDSQSLSTGLCQIGSRSNPKLKESSPLPDLVLGAAEHVLLFEKSIINVASADAVLKLAEAILNCNVVDTDVDKIRASICDMTKSILKVEWRNPQDGAVDKGSKFNAHVESILNVFLASASLTSMEESDNKIVEALVEYTDEMEKVLVKKGRDSKSDIFPTFTK